jgi:hypothetical protein
MNKKGNAVIDGIVIVLILVTFAIIAVVGYSVFNQMDTFIQSSEMSNQSKDISSTLNAQYPSLFDGFAVFILVMAWISALIFSFMIDTHPIFLIISLILIAFILVIAAIVANGYEETMINDAEFSSYSVNFPMMNFIITHLVETIMVISMSIGLALFAKSRL